MGGDAGAQDRVVKSAMRWLPAWLLWLCCLAATALAAAPPIFTGELPLTQETVWLQVQPGERGQVLLTVRAPAGVEQIEALLLMPDHAMTPYRVLLSPAGDGSHAGAAVLPMPGRWRITLQLQTDAGIETAGTEFSAPGAPGNVPKARLSLPMLAHSPLTFALGLSMALLGGWLLRDAWRQRQVMSLALGLCGAAAGLVFVVQAMTVVAYPTTFTANPVAAGPAAVAAGERVYTAHCLACHGAGGRGDGPDAKGLMPPPADLTAGHLELHTDGDLYWWISRGIDGTAMPGFADRLDDAEIWQVIHYLRSRRAGG